jgi:serine/threonine-protein kinase
MGVVYRAIDKRLKRPVAIKLLPPELAFRRDVRQRFQREAETAAQLSHPNIVPIYSVDEVGNLVFFVMACVDGDNLATQLRKRGPLPTEDIKRYLTEVADALAYAHSRGVIHRDIKPDNILVDALDGRAMVTDFGIARAAEGGDGARLTATGLAIGTPAYMSPEQASGDRDVDGRSDLYALGILAYQMLTGEPPFTGNTTPVLLVKHLTETPVPVEERRPDTPPMLAAMVMRLLEKDPAHRFQSAAELAQALRSGIVPAASLRSPRSPVPGTTAASASGGGRAMPTSSKGGELPPAKDWPSTPMSERQEMFRQAQGRSSSGAGTLAHGDHYAPTADELARWEKPIVQKFRQKVAPFLFVNVVLIFVSIFSGSNFLPITAIWSIYLSYQYAKLWSDGYDWRDVLRQPRDRMFGDVISDVGESVESTFSKKKREELRAKGRTGFELSGALSPRSPVTGVRNAPVRMDALGPYANAVQSARSARDEIARLLATLPASDRAKIPDVAQTSSALVEKVEQIAQSLASTEQSIAERPLAPIDAEIERLEAAANPLEAGSDARVRRLASLRRERRATIDLGRRRDDLMERLESCSLALENIRLDLVRLRTGGSTVQSVTLVAEQAMALAREVDRVVEAAQEVRDLTSVRGAGAAR